MVLYECLHIGIKLQLSTQNNNLIHLYKTKHEYQLTILIMYAINSHLKIKGNNFGNEATKSRRQTKSKVDIKFLINSK